jgi:hypothetical protein
MFFLEMNFIFLYHNDELIIRIASPKYVAPSTTVSNMKEHVIKRQSNANIAQTKRMLYHSIEDMIQSRMNAAKQNRGNQQTISYEASNELTQRNIRTIGGGYQFTQDIRLEWPLMLELTKEQVHDINTTAAAASTTKIAIYYAEHGWPYTKEYIDLEVEQLKPNVMKTLPGSHHFHADPETANRVIEEIFQFIIQS